MEQFDDLAPPDRPFSNKINIKLEKTVCRKVSWKNMFWGFVFDVKMGGLDRPKLAFRIIFVVKNEFYGSCEI